MKNFDLNSYGVQEMDAKAMEEANGGKGVGGGIGGWILEKYLENIGTITEWYFNECAKGTYSHPGPGWDPR